MNRRINHCLHENHGLCGHLGTRGYAQYLIVNVTLSIAASMFTFTLKKISFSKTNSVRKTVFKLIYV